MTSATGIYVAMLGIRPADPRVHLLHPGDVVCVERGERVETLLGSCIAVILTDRARTRAAMCHVVHCGAGGNGEDTTAAADAAIDRMYALLDAQGLNARLCEGFVYGGGNMFPGLYRETHVGDSNACCVLERLERDGIRVGIRDLGGRAYRRVVWTVGPELPEVVAVAVENGT